MYKYGHGVAQNYVIATQLYRKAVNQGFAKAKYAIGLCYLDQDKFSDALRMFNEAKNNGCKNSEEGIKEIFKIKKKIQLSEKRWKNLKEIYIRKSISKKVISYKDCAFCGSPENYIPGIVIHNCCSRCKMTYYCSVRCQKNHWNIGNHKKYCLTPEERKVPIELKN